MNRPTLCIIHEAIGVDNAIAKVAMLHVRAALEAGWDVSVVAKYLDPSLHEKVNWLKLTVPSRGFLLKWTTARHFIRKALGDRRFDVIDAHQPQVADLSDVFHCHFLTRVAYERKCLETRAGLRQRVVRMQQQGVLYAEDRCYRRWNPATQMIFCSELLRKEFTRLYGAPPLQQVLVNACPPVQFASVEQRRAARRALIGDDFNGLVLGYLGGLQERKGYKRVLSALRGHRDIFLLMGGIHSEGFHDPALEGHMKSVGLVDDLATFYAACDVFVVPSEFDTGPLVMFEAAALGVPVIGTDGCGNLHHLLEFKAGLEWRTEQSLAELVRLAASQRNQFNRGAIALAEAVSETRQTRALLEVYGNILSRKRKNNPAAAQVKYA